MGHNRLSMYQKMTEEDDNDAEDSPRRTRAHFILIAFGVFAMLLALVAVIFGGAPAERCCKQCQPQSPVR